MENSLTKYHLALKPLSNEHYEGMLFCRRIREGFQRNIPPERIKKYADWFWKNYLVTHFEIEEKYLFPVLAAGNSKVKKAVAEHRRLKRLFENDSELYKSLNLIEEELEKHIRFEERELFKDIEQEMPAAQLEQIEEYHHDLFIDDWNDEFWKE